MDGDVRFPPAERGTRVDVSIDYGRLAAIASGGLLRPQAENEIMHRLSALRMLEVGVLGERAAAD